jgi:hypothetical protein
MDISALYNDAANKKYGRQQERVPTENFASYTLRRSISVGWPNESFPSAEVWTEFSWRIGIDYLSLHQQLPRRFGGGDIDE